MTVCKRALYAGRVQGVGFRATARMIASGHPVAGYVRNLPDGRVELVAEGEPDAVTAFLDEVNREMGSLVADTRIDDVPPQGFGGFTVRH
jgi:acylphosphatase